MKTEPSHDADCDAHKGAESHPDPQSLPAAPSPTCDHKNHGLPGYARGCSYASHLVNAIEAAQEGAHEAALHNLSAADLILWPLGSVDDAEEVRDFLAGVAGRMGRYVQGRGSR